MTVADDLPHSFASTLQHLDLLNQRLAKLHAAREEAEHQVLHRAGSAYRNGEIDILQLTDIYETYSALAIPGRTSRWNKHIDINWHVMGRIAEHSRPNGPENTWVGDWPLAPNGCCPERGVNVVYVLFGPDNEPCYVGSTKTFRQRLKVHEKDGKEFQRWQAYMCRDREHAYQLEERLLKERLPRLNRKAAR